MSETYKVTLTYETPYAGCDSEETFALAEYGYTDEEWDALTPRAQGTILDGWAEDNFWNAGFSYGGDVERG